MRFELDESGTSHPIITIVVTTPDKRLQIMGEPSIDGRNFRLVGVHVHGASSNELGGGRLRSIAAAAMEEFGFDEIVIEGEVRTSGANPGRKRGPIRFSRERRTPLDGRLS